MEIKEENNTTKNIELKQDGGSWAGVSSRDCGNIVTKAIEIANRSVENK
jgi:hypothetical protein